MIKYSQAIAEQARQGLLSAIRTTLGDRQKVVFEDDTFFAYTDGNRRELYKVVQLGEDDIRCYFYPTDDYCENAEECYWSFDEMSMDELYNVCCRVEGHGD